VRRRRLSIRTYENGESNRLAGKTHSFIFFSIYNAGGVEIKLENAVFSHNINWERLMERTLRPWPGCALNIVDLAVYLVINTVLITIG
jgi:hypothetical protein